MAHQNEGKNSDKTDSNPPQSYEITAQGSLGVLALGAVGIQAWRKKREEEKLKNEQSTKK